MKMIDQAPQTAAELRAEMREEIRKLREQLVEERAARNFYFCEADEWDKMGPSWAEQSDRQKQIDRDYARSELIEEGHLPSAADTASTASDCIQGLTTHRRVPILPSTDTNGRG